MINFEKRISKSARVKAKNLDPSLFILNLKNRQIIELKRKQRFRSAFAASAFIFIISLVTISQLNNIDLINKELDLAGNNDFFYDEYIFSDYNDNVVNEDEFTVFMYEESFYYDAEELVYLSEFFIENIDTEKTL